MVASSSFRFSITDAPLAECLAIAIRGAAGGKVEGWKVDKGPGPDPSDPHPDRLILVWSTQSPGSHPLPAPLKGEALVGFVRSWLETVDYGKEDDTDGHCKKGWHVYNDAWGYIDGDPYAFVAIEPVWLVYGK